MIQIKSKFLQLTTNKKNTNPKNSKKSTATDSTDIFHNKKFSKINLFFNSKKLDLTQTPLSSSPNSNNHKISKNPIPQALGKTYKAPNPRAAIAFLENLTSGSRAGGDSWEFGAYVLCAHTQNILKTDKNIKNDEKLLSIYQNIEQQLWQSYQLIEMIAVLRSDLMNNPNDIAGRTNKLDAILISIKQSIDEDDFTLIPLCPNDNHATWMQFEKEKDDTTNMPTQQYSIRIFNRGDGVEKWHSSFKKSISDKKKYDPVYTVKHVDQDLLTLEDLRHLFLIYCTPVPEEDTLITTPVNEIDNHYAWASERGIVDPDEIHFFQTPQNSGNCSYKSLNAFMRYQLPEGGYYELFFGTLTQNIRENNQEFFSDEKKLVESSIEKEKKFYNRAKIAQKKQLYIKDNSQAYPLITGSLQLQALDIEQINSYFLNHNADKKLLYYQKDSDELFFLQKDSSTQNLHCQQLIFTTESLNSEPKHIEYPIYSLPDW